MNTHASATLVSQRRRQTRDRRTVWLWAVIASVVFLSVSPPDAMGESALDLISGFDSKRLGAVFPVTDEQAAGEMAKVLYRLRRASEEKLSEKATATREAAGVVSVGEAIDVDGKITAMRRYKVPVELIEFLELSSYLEVQLELSGNPSVPGQSILVYAPETGNKMLVGDRVAAKGVVVDVTLSAANAIAAGNLQWYPSRAPSAGWQLLADAGVDVSAIAALGTRNGQPLSAADTAPFYSILAAAKKLGSATDVATPANIDPVVLLRDPEKHVGDWVRMKLNTVRVTKVTIADAGLRTRIGQDHYYQVDASGSLGDVVIQIERPDDPDGPPIQLDNSYPVSLVATELPDFLVAEMRGGREAADQNADALVTMVSHPVSVDGFFFRLWSYDSEFMARRGGGKQVGPLMMVARWRSMARDDSSGGDLAVIGYSLLALLIVTVFGTLIWNRFNARGDREVRQRQQEREASELQFPEVD